MILALLELSIVLRVAPMLLISRCVAGKFFPPPSLLGRGLRRLLTTYIYVGGETPHSPYMSSNFFSIAVLNVILFLFWKWFYGKQQKEKVLTPQSNPFMVDPVESTFNWADKKPLRNYPFKNKEYKLTMGILTIKANDWLLLENTYLQRLNEKKMLISNTHPGYPKDKDTRKSTLFSSPEAEPAIREFYDVVLKYVCDRYPMHFVYDGEKSRVFNSITSESVPAKAGDQSCEELMEILTRTIEEDFIIMIPDETKKNEPNGDEYHFKGGVFAFAAGFDPIDKINKPLSAIHEPIPAYDSKLKLSMNRFFNRLESGKFVSRSNFSIQAHDRLFVIDDNKGYHLTEEELKQAIPYDELNFDSQVHYRSERQVLFRLPVSRAVVFTIRTYLHPLSEFKSQSKEVPETLLGALQKFPDDMSKYKGLPKLIPAVSQYLEEIIAE